MNFKDWTYHKKNLILLPAAVLLFLLCWYLAFGKTYSLFQEYQSLRSSLSSSDHQQDGNMLTAQLDAQCSLLDVYSTDSAQWVGGLLTQIGDLLSEHPIELNYENKAIGLGELTVEREVQLSGSFKSLQEALTCLENRFYVKHLQAFVDKGQLKYMVRIGIVKNN